MISCARVRGRDARPVPTPAGRIRAGDARRARLVCARQRGSNRPLLPSLQGRVGVRFFGDNHLHDHGWVLNLSPMVPTGSSAAGGHVTNPST
jgi:hypothetical protein